MLLWNKSNAKNKAGPAKPATGELSPAHLSNGIWAENQAEIFLRKHGLRSREKNFSCKHGEIDLIMEADKQLVFVEVRYRHQHKFGSGIDSVDSRKQVKLRRSAEFYLQTHKLTDKVNCRFDVIGVTDAPTAASTLEKASITPETRRAQIEWIENAF